MSMVVVVACPICDARFGVTLHDDARGALVLDRQTHVTLRLSPDGALTIREHLDGHRENQADYWSMISDWAAQMHANYRYFAARSADYARRARRARRAQVSRG